jgi:Flp pilus assembly protein TadG
MRRMIGGKSRRGQSLLEFALILPLIFLVFVNIVNFGAFFYSWIVICNASRTGVQYMVLGGSSINNPTPASPALIQTLITGEDVLSLINPASVSVTTCIDNKSGGSDVYRSYLLASSTSSCTTGVADPEPAYYVVATVDVTYTFQPIIPLWDFPALKIHATLPPTTIHRKAVMRML